MLTCFPPSPPVGVRRVESDRSGFRGTASQKNIVRFRLLEIDAEQSYEKFLRRLADESVVGESVIRGADATLVGRAYQSFRFERGNLAG